METNGCQSKVTFSIEYRSAKPEQKAAGKRLFSRLIGRATAVGAAGAAACNKQIDKKAEKESPPH
jgi:hypothetical protein